jgi:hypothetical protein
VTVYPRPCYSPYTPYDSHSVLAIEQIIRGSVENGQTKNTHSSYLQAVLFNLGSGLRMRRNMKRCVWAVVVIV